MDYLVFFFMHVKPLESSELLRYQDLHLGQMDLLPEPVLVAPYLDSLVFSKVLQGLSKVLSFHSWFSLWCLKTTYKRLYQPGGT